MSLSLLALYLPLFVLLLALMGILFFVALRYPDSRSGEAYWPTVKCLGNSMVCYAASILVSLGVAVNSQDEAKEFLLAAVLIQVVAWGFVIVAMKGIFGLVASLPASEERESVSIDSDLM